MESCNTKELRENLKSFLDQVSKEGTLRINRSSETFIIMKGDEYIEMKEQIIELQETVISLMGTVANNVKILRSPKLEVGEADNIQEEVIDRVLMERR